MEWQSLSEQGEGGKTGITAYFALEESTPAPDTWRIACATQDVRQAACTNLKLGFRTTVSGCYHFLLTARAAAHWCLPELRVVCVHCSPNYWPRYCKNTNQALISKS